MYSSRKANGAECVLFLSEVLVVNRLGPSRNGALLSNLILLSLGILVVVVTLQTARRFGKLGRYFWHLTALTYSIGALAQALRTYSQSFYPGFAKGSPTSYSPFGLFPWEWHSSSNRIPVIGRSIGWQTLS